MSKSNLDKLVTAVDGVNAWCITNDEGHVGRIVVKWNKRSGVVTAFLQYYGSPVIIGRAGGGGYNKVKAAIQDAAQKFVADHDSDDSDESVNFHAAFAQDAVSFETALENAGMKIFGVL